MALSVVVGMFIMAIFFTDQQRDNIMAENERAFRKLTETVSAGLKVIMLEGDTEIAQSFADSLKSIPEIIDFRILRIDGNEAFNDNKTIYNVNTRIGEEEFIPRDKEAEIEIVSMADRMFNKVLDSKEIVSFRETDSNGNGMLTLFNPVKNEDKCFSCHGSSHDLRGVIKISTSLVQVEKSIRRSLIISVGMLSALTVVIILLIGYLIRKISMPIIRVADELQNISKGEGNLNVSLEVKGRDEIAQLSSGFNTFVSKIRGVIQDFGGVTDDLRGMAEQLSLTTDRSNENISKQRADIQEIAASIEQIATSIDEIASNAREGADVANKVDEESRSGKKEMDRTIETMNRLSEGVGHGSRTIEVLHEEMGNIGSILVEIEEITDQTNILALNASIEAQRAGEQGRGFAVVASEVRKLADRTYDSTQGITEIMGKLRSQTDKAVQIMQESREQTELSMQQINMSSKLLENITSSAGKISMLSQYIANAVAEERKAAELVSNSIQNISTSADNTALESENTTAKSDELARLSEHLKSLVSQFKT